MASSLLRSKRALLSPFILRMTNTPQIASMTRAVNAIRAIWCRDRVNLRSAICSAATASRLLFTRDVVVMNLSIFTAESIVSIYRLL